MKNQFKNNFILEKSAKFTTEGLLLVDGKDTSGTAILKIPFTLNKSFYLDIEFKLDSNFGAKDLDGTGGDGFNILIKNDLHSLSIGFDTYKNIENISGNEINIKMDNNIICQGQAPMKLNSGILLKGYAKYDAEDKVIIAGLIHKNERVPVAAFPFTNKALSHYMKEECQLLIIATSGAATSKHLITAFSFSCR